MSEGALLCVAPAVAAAVRDATGVVIRDLPLTPERVWRALTSTAPPDATRRRDADPMTHAFALDAPPGGTLAETKALVGGKAANLGVMSRELGLPVPPGFVDHDRDLPGLPRERLAGRSRRRAARPDGRRRGGRRAPVRRPGGPAARQRPVRCAGLDARDDGHDPRTSG